MLAVAAHYVHPSYLNVQKTKKILFCCPGALHSWGRNTPYKETSWGRCHPLLRCKHSTAQQHALGVLSEHLLFHFGTSLLSKLSIFPRRYELDRREAVAASPVAGITAGDLRTSVCRVVIYLRKDMSGASALHTPQCRLDEPPLACPKTKTCTYRSAVGLGNKYVRLNVGGTLFYTTLQVLTRQESLLKAMFSGKQEVFTDREGGSLLKKKKTL